MPFTVKITIDNVAFNSESAKEARAKASPRGENKLKKLFKDYADAEDVKELFDKLKEMANGGDMDAIKTLLAYLIGKPKESVDITTDGERLNQIEVTVVTGQNKHSLSALSGIEEKDNG